MLGTILVTLIGGIIIGALGKMLAPGDRDNIPFWLTIVCGIAALAGLPTPTSAASMQVRTASAAAMRRRLTGSAPEVGSTRANAPLPWR